jgi:hypothetical protein
VTGDDPLELARAAAPHLVRADPLEHATATLRERLGERFDEAWAEGRAVDNAPAQELARA